MQAKWLTYQSDNIYIMLIILSTYYFSETNMLQFGGQPAHPSIAFMNPRFNQSPAGRMDQSDYAHFLLSSSSGSSGTTLSHVAHPPSAGSFPTTSTHLDPGLRFGSLEYDFDADWDGVTNMEPHD